MFWIFRLSFYGEAYGISYGIGFGALLTGKLLPGKNIIVQAMVGATDSAKSTFTGLGKRQ